VSLHTPVAFIIFNRPEVTERVFLEIARARPQKLFVIADGPRNDKPGEAEKCAATRAIIDRVDWECDVRKNYSDTNLGCGHRPPSGLRWVFDQVEEAIILEDDCLPHPTFFHFCEELLDRYRDDNRVMHIGGNDFHSDQLQSPFSYAFSRYTLTWGWATWRRAFQFYDRDMKLWPQLRDTSWLTDILIGDPTAVAHWKAIFDRAYNEGDNATYWAFQWLFACWTQAGLAILPNTNLISNIGYGDNATHTARKTDPRSNLPTSEMSFPLNHPPFIVRHAENEGIISERVVRPRQGRSLYRELRRECVGALPHSVRRSLSSLKSRLIATSLTIVSLPYRRLLQERRQSSRRKE
jgi:hypothetical protein